MRIFKYPLPIRGPGEVTIKMPPCQVLSVGWQDQTFVVWAIVDTDYPPEDLTFYAAWTGDAPPLTQDSRPWRYINTVQGESIVWHFFEEPS